PPARCAASANTTGVLPAPPATKLPTQITGTAARCGLVKARRNRAAASQAVPAGNSTSDRSPGGCAQNAGALRITHAVSAEAPTPEPVRAGRAKARAALPPLRGHRDRPLRRDSQRLRARCTAENRKATPT